MGAGVFLILWLIFGIMDWRTDTVRGDFALYSLEASRVLWEGGDPYDRDEVGRNYKYQPINIIVLGPLTLPPPVVAQSFWTTLNLFLVLGAIAMQWAFLRDRKLAWWLILILLVLSFRTVHGNLKLGQWNTPVYSLGVMGALLLYQNRLVRGSLLLGLGASLKFLPALFLAPLLLVGKWKQALSGVVAIGLISLAVPVLVLGPGRVVDLFEGFQGKATKVYEDQTGRHGERVGVSLNALVYLYLTSAIREDISPERGIGWADLSAPAARNIATGVSALFFAGAIAVTLLCRRRHGDRLAFLLILGLWISTILLALPHVRMHYLIYCITPFLALLAYWQSHKGVTRAGWIAFAMILLAFFFQVLTSQDITGRRLSTIINLYGGNTGQVLALYAGHVVALLSMGREDEAPPA